MENLTSVVIPSRKEVYLRQTVEDILKKAEGDVEVIVILDGYEDTLPNDPRIKIIHNPEPKGMRNAINSGAAIAKGKYLMKCDAHCCFDQGFDVKLAKDCEPNWTVVPRRYGINKRTWDKIDGDYYDFQYISKDIKGYDWPEYGARVKGEMIVDLMTSQGSCWFMHKAWFDEIGGLDEQNYGTMGAEAQETCLKTWLSGGRYVLNRNTWYAHKKKREDARGSDRGYKKPVKEWRKSRAYAKECWLNNRWPKQVRTFEWLLRKFAPVPSWHSRKEGDVTRQFISDRFKLNRGTEDSPRVIKGLNRKGLIALWKDLGYKVGAEIGVQKGDFSSEMFKAIPNLKMFLIDPYIDYKGGHHYARKHESGEAMAKARMKGYDAIWLKEMSEIVVSQIPDRSLDFIYIDGNHKYDWVMTDLILWQRKVKYGGMISGHDYNTIGRKSAREIKKAVDDYVGFHKIMPVYLTDNTAMGCHADRHASFFWVKG